MHTCSDRCGCGTDTRNWSGWIAGNPKACSRIKTPPNNNSHVPPRRSINIETRSADIMVQRDIRTFGALENESRADKAVNQHRPHDLQTPPRICNTLQLGASSSTIQQPLHVLYPTPFMRVASNPPTRVGGDTTQGVVVPTRETFPVISPSQLYRRMDWTCPHEVGTAPAPIQNAGVTSATHSILTTIPSESLSPSAATLPPSTEGSPNGVDHGITHSGVQQGTTQELNPCVEYVAPNKGAMSGGVEVTIVGTNFPHTLSLIVYFGTNPALVVSWEHLVRGSSIDGTRPPDSKDSGNYTVFCSRRIISWNCRRANFGRTPRISARD